MKILLPSYKKVPENIQELVSNLRAYEQSSIVTTGSRILWELFRKKTTSYNTDDFLVSSFGPKIIMLAMATCKKNVSQKKRLSIDQEFLTFCHQLFKVESSIGNKEFLQNESEEIFNFLMKSQLPKEYLLKERIHKYANLLSIQREAGEQNLGYEFRFEEAYMDYAIIKIIDSKTNNLITGIFVDKFKVNPLQFMKAAFSNFNLAKVMGGPLDFSVLKFDQKINEKLYIDMNICKKIALYTSYNESNLYPIWYEGTLLKSKKLYQKFVPLPISNKPIMFFNMNKYNPNKFHIVSPQSYFRGLRQFIFTEIYNSCSSFGLAGKLIGDATAHHIHSVLEHEFGKNSVLNLDNDNKNKKADFLIKLELITLIIEVKTNLGGIESRSISSPEDVASTWKRLYQACQQCANSIKENKTEANRTLCIVIIADHMSVQCKHFEAYARESGVFHDLGINAIQFIGWNRLERLLFASSSLEFQRTLLKNNFLEYEQSNDIEPENNTYYKGSDFYNKIKQEIEN